MATAPAIGRRRWTIGVLLGVGILINYFDRVNISVAAPQLQQEFGLTPGDLGPAVQRLLLVLRHSADAGRHGARPVRRDESQPDRRVPVGRRLGHGGLRLAASARSSAPACCSASPRRRLSRPIPRRPATGFRAANARPPRRSSTPRPNSPTSSACRWSPSPSCRSAGDGASASQRILSFAYFVAYWFLYRDPSQDPKLSRGGIRLYPRRRRNAARVRPTRAPFGMLGYLLQNRKVWGLTIGFAAYGYTLLSLPDLAAGLSCQPDAHEHHQVGRLLRDPLVFARSRTSSSAAG